MALLEKAYHWRLPEIRAIPSVSLGTNTQTGGQRSSSHSNHKYCNERHWQFHCSLRRRLIPGAKHLQQLLDAELGEKLLYIVDFQDQEFPWSVCSSWSFTYVGPCPEELSRITLALPTSQTSLQSLEADFILFYFLTSSGNCESS